MDEKRVALAYTRIISHMYAHGTVRTIAYSDAWRMALPGVPWNRYYGGSWGPHVIEAACQKLGWPQLNVLFVNKTTGVPGGGHATVGVRPYDWREELQKVKAFKDYDEKALITAIRNVAV